MSDLEAAIARTRQGVCAVLRIHMNRPEKRTPKRVKPAQYGLTFAGSAFGISDDRYIVTAYHVFNDGQPRVNADRFYAFVVPDNGPTAYHFPVVGFPLEDPILDIAVLEIGPCATPGHHVRGLPITSRPVQDGTRVLTYGFPAPVIANAGVSEMGDYLGGNFFLKSHANAGIVAGQFVLDDGPIYEFNVGWYNGESGGPVCLLEPFAVAAVMKSYRGIQAKHGIVPGPHAARPVRPVLDRLLAFGAQQA